ncbi:MAG: alpha/beta hydrolase [Erythrobacter sp.]|uniref:alpha/beta fold hydrolase n=1 Tax=Erythrobacter sp. TaxID=1042 RepID=UPI0026385F88|nr:alpha/beta hydrolase [Erythrobacter sp.]MDJ0978215.1 alpha/beta hydrolase [Erythrobacter sp.]
MPTITTPNTGLKICYDEAGDRANETILLIMGLGVQLTHWPDEFIEALVERGYHVVRFDNRDIGLSEKMGEAKPPHFAWQLLASRIGWKPRVPYKLAEMAADAAGLLDALEIDKAHAVGASMGGMIGQLLAINHRDKLHSLTSVMSTTGNPKAPRAEKEAMRALTSKPASLDEDVLVEHGLMIARAIGSPGFPRDEQRARERTRANVQRSVYPMGLPRQLAAIIDDGDRRKRLAGVTTPTLVLHGEDDPLVKVGAGEDTAKAIPGARLVTIPGWGHDFPLQLVERIADEIAGHASGVSAKVSVAAQ